MHKFLCIWGWIGWCNQNFLGFMALKRGDKLFPHSQMILGVLLLFCQQRVRTSGRFNTKQSAKVCIVDSCVPWASHTLFLDTSSPSFVCEKTSFINLNVFASSRVSYSLMSMVLREVYSQLIRIWFKQMKSLYK